MASVVPGIKPEKLIVVARIGAPHGVRGDLKLQVFTESCDIFDFQNWHIRLNNTWQPMSGYTIKTLGNHYLIHFEHCQDRDLAKRYVNAELAVPRKEFPEPESGFYWSDLEGLKVFNSQNMEYGTVDYILETGANAVLVVKGETERLIPFVKHVIKQVDLASGVIIVDWEPDY